MGFWKRKPAVVVTIPELVSEEVVGESNYVDAIDRIVQRHGSELHARLYWDKRNKHDPGAVAVELVAGDDRALCGYLPRTVAPTYLPTIKEQTKLGRIVQVPASVAGSGRPHGFYGVWVGQRYSVAS